MKQYKRGFLFGCSFTKYHWPTWADVLSNQVDFPVINAGLSGIGNVGILHEITKHDIQYSFTPDDLIIVVWTHWSREDRWVNGKWACCGNVFSGPPDRFYDDHFVKKYWSWENDIIKNSSAIILANKSFPITDQYSIMNYGEPEYSIELRNESSLFDFYLKALPYPKVFDCSNNTRFNGTLSDPHPDMLNHVEFYNKLARQLNLPIVEENSVYSTIQKNLSLLFKNIKSKKMPVDSIIREYLISEHSDIFTVQ